MASMASVTSNPPSFVARPVGGTKVERPWIVEDRGLTKNPKLSGDYIGDYTRYYPGT